ncbi:excinuclease ATPase subunit [Marinobacterium lutimaris]|uniref:Excinuclease ATPase subunit n=1 Tax=Marinobacterium lutimaris TaxID=568106 RepID=A0A1H5TAB8_9GAMM|nr:excinuclease ATPase subunit [Marinobacterium lutimaris]SEF59765.1 hypothetical protein SAMN05444390_10121 [Marinobacterium lutimaris]
MKVFKLAVSSIALSLALVSTQAYSRDTEHHLSIQEALQSSDFKDKLDPSIKLYFGSQGHSQVSSRIASGVVTNKKTNAFAKSDEEACRWVFLSALLALQERAKNDGGNAVININSFYKRELMQSNTDYECHAGAIMAGVALKGDVVTVK